MRQKNLRVFVCSQGEDHEIMDYLNKNQVFLQGFLLIFTFLINKELKNFLETLGINYFQQYPYNSLKLKDSTNTKEIPKIQITEELQYNNVAQPSSSASTLVIHRTIRSGEEVSNQGDITIFGQINNGALIHAEGNIQIFGEVNGNISCNGEYLIIRTLKQGNVLFNGEIIDKERLSHGAKKIYKNANQIMIEDL